MSRALQRVLGRPGLIAALWLFQLAMAAALSLPVRGSIRAVMGDFALLDDGFLLANLGHLLADNRGLGPQMLAAALGGWLAGAAGWTVIAGGVITRLATPGSATEGFFSATGRWLPAMVATSLWHLLLRIVVLAVAVTATAFLPRLVSVAIVALVVAFLTCTLDIARVQVVLHGAHPFHPKTAARAFVQAVRYPRVLLRSMVLSVLQWGLLGLMAYLAVLGLNDGNGVIAGRILLLPVIALGLWRVAVVVEAGWLQARSKA